MNTSEEMSRVDLSCALSEICVKCPRLADELLDLHLAMEGGCTAGKCAKAYFRVCENAEFMPCWQRVRSEVVSRLAVEAWCENGERLEVLSFDPESGEDLESYCRRMLHLVSWDRAYDRQPQRMNFCFRS